MKIQKNSKSKYGYDFINQNNEIIEMKSKTTDNYLHFPEIINNRKMISIKELEKNLINDGDIFDLSNLQRKSYERNSSNENVVKISNIEKSFDEIEKFIDEEDMEIFSNLKEKVVKKFKRKSIEIEIENQMKLIEELKKKMEEISN